MPWEVANGQPSERINLVAVDSLASGHASKGIKMSSVMFQLRNGTYHAY